MTARNTIGAHGAVLDTDSGDQLHEYYVALINNLVAEDREELIPALAAEYEQLREQFAARAA